MQEAFGKAVLFKVSSVRQRAIKDTTYLLVISTLGKTATIPFDQTTENIKEGDTLLLEDKGGYSNFIEVVEQ